MESQPDRFEPTLQPHSVLFGRNLVFAWISKALGTVGKVRFLLALDRLRWGTSGVSITEVQVGMLDEGDQCPCPPNLRLVFQTIAT
jgi:hypothetical protein